MDDDVSTFDGVSRETDVELRQYLSLVQKWNASISLVSRRDIDLIWDRHIRESIHVVAAAPVKSTWADLGSGGGFPGLVAAIMRRDVQVTLVESDARKAAFLRAVIRDMSLRATVIADRIEAVPPIRADVISARALAPLPRLLGYCHRHGNRDTIYMVPKGNRWPEEHLDASKAWCYDFDVIEISGGKNVILRISNLGTRPS